MSRWPSYLGTGDFVDSGAGMTSRGGVYTLRLGRSGDFCVGVPWLDIWCSTLSPGPGTEAFLKMENDGELSTYPGRGGNPTGPAIWTSNSEQPSTGDFYAVLQDDATLEVHRGTSPEDDRGVIWSCVDDARYKIRPNPVVKIEDATSIAYDLAAGVIENWVIDHGLGDMASVTYTNDTPQQQSVTLDLKTEVTQLSQWSDSLEVGISVETELDCGVPFVAEGKVTMTAEVKNTYTWGGSQTVSDGREFQVPVVVAPNQTVQADITCRRSEVSVPYTVHCALTLEYADKDSNRRGAGSYYGVYRGANSSDFDVHTKVLQPI